MENDKLFVLTPSKEGNKKVESVDENLVSKMESGELSLDDSLKAFERGIELTRTCQSTLEAAELRIQMLTKDNKLESIDTLSNET